MVGIWRSNREVRGRPLESGYGENRLVIAATRVRCGVYSVPIRLSPGAQVDVPRAQVPDSGREHPLAARRRQFSGARSSLTSA
jgi:hypothetical protein